RSGRPRRRPGGRGGAGRDGGRSRRRLGGRPRRVRQPHGARRRPRAPAPGAAALAGGVELQLLGARWLEDPLPPEDVEGYVALSAALEMPVAAGETECTRWQFEERLRQKAVDLILPDICRAGGISEGRKIATVADI